MRKQRRVASGVEYVELEPVAASADLPLVIGLHGRGSSGEDLAQVAAWLNPEGFRFVLPDGPLRVENPPWTSGYSWYALGQRQAPDIALARERLFGFIEAVEQRYATPRERTVLLGFSQGAVLALDLGLRSPGPFAGLAALNGYLFAPETLGPELRAAVDRQVLLIHGTYDDVVPVDAARLTRDVLEAAGLEPEYHELPMGHQVTAEALGLVRVFLERVLRRATQSTS